MTPTQHTIASGVISAAFAYFTKSTGGTIACFLSGILIDLDHVLDYWLAKGKPPLRYRDLSDFCSREKDGKIYLILHTYELHIIFWLIVLFGKVNVIWWGLAVGMTTHFLLDQVFNTCLRPFVYFGYYRFKRGFSKEYIFREEYYKKFV